MNSTVELSFKVKIAFFCTYGPVNGAWDPQRKKNTDSKKHRTRYPNSTFATPT